MEALKRVSLKLSLVQRKKTFIRGVAAIVAKPVLVHVGKVFVSSKSEATGEARLANPMRQKNVTKAASRALHPPPGNQWYREYHSL